MQDMLVIYEWLNTGSVCDAAKWIAIQLHIVWANGKTFEDTVSIE